MDEERKVWERMDDEPVKWFSRFDKFRIMKPWVRSVNAVFEEEEAEKHGKARTKIPGDWYQIAKQWQWDERAAKWDAYRIAERDRKILLEEAEVLKERYALKHERIKALNEIADLLKDEVFEKKKYWTEDVKAVGLEPHYIEKFNDALIAEYRSSLTDIAAEMGERVKKKDITVTNMPPNVYLTDDDFNPDDDGTVIGEEDGSDQTSSS